MGFQRFLTVLNKGVDMDLLTKIVNDGCEVVEPVETVLNHKPPAAVAGPCIAPSNGSKQSNRTDESRTASGSHSLGSSSRSRSPPAMRKKQEEEENAKATEQHKQLQNILKTLGLNLEVGEMSRLANRTQERLYGTKHNNTNSDYQKKPLRQPRKRRKSFSRSSSSSSFSGSGSTRSSSRSVSPPCNRLTRSKDSLLRRTSESGGDIEEPPKHGAQTAHTIETSRQPHQQNPQNLHSGPSSTYHNESFPQCGQYNIQHSSFSNQAVGPYWPPHGGPYPPSYYPNEQPYQQNPYPPFHEPAAQPGSYYCHEMAMMKDIDLQVTPNWAESEWRNECTVRPRCLMEISTQDEGQSKPAVPPQYLQEFSIQQRKPLSKFWNCRQSKQAFQSIEHQQRQKKKKRRKMNKRKKKLAELVAKVAALKEKAQQEAKASELVTLDEEKPPPIERRLVDQVAKAAVLKEKAQQEAKASEPVTLDEERPPPIEAKIKADDQRIKVCKFCFCILFVGHNPLSVSFQYQIK